MTSLEPKERMLAVCLAALAGFVDAVGFLALGGFFVSFMSGNTTRLGVGISQASDAALQAGTLIAMFVMGVMLGALIDRSVRQGRAVVLTAVAVLLLLASSSSLFNFTAISAAFMVMAMGAENLVFSRNGEVHVGLTYMTGTLVKFGQRIVAAFFGGDKLGWWPYLQLWMGLATGATLGSLCYVKCGLASLWFAAVAAAALAFAARSIDSLRV